MDVARIAWGGVKSLHISEQLAGITILQRGLTRGLRYSGFFKEQTPKSTIHKTVNAATCIVNSILYTASFALVAGRINRKLGWAAGIGNSTLIATSMFVSWECGRPPSSRLTSPSTLLLLQRILVGVSLIKLSISLGIIGNAAAKLAPAHRKLSAFGAVCTATLIVADPRDLWKYLNFVIWGPQPTSPES